MHGSRYAALAARPVRAGAPLVRVPCEALLTPAVARRCAACAAVAACAPLGDWQMLTLALLHERSLGAASAWAPYLAVLPPQPRDDDDASAFLHPLLWPSDFAAQALAGSPMLAKVQSRLATCAEDGALLRAAVAAAAAAAPGAQLPPPPSDADVRWAASVLLSRAFYLEDVHEHADEAESDGDGADEQDSDEDGDDDAEFASYSTLALVPWADSLNHSCAAGDAAVLRYDRASRCAVLHAHTAYATGDQVFDSYGVGRAPVDTLLDHGFAELPLGEEEDDDDDSIEDDFVSPVDRIDLPASALGPVAAANAALLAAVGLPPEAATAALGCDGPDDGVLAWARVASATPAELSAAGWRDADAAAVSRARAAGQPVPAAAQQLAYTVMGGFITRGSATNEAAALQRLCSACQTQTAAYPTALLADESLLVELEMAPAAKARSFARLHALRALISEKRALEGAAAAIALAQAALRATKDRATTLKARGRRRV